MENQIRQMLRERSDDVEHRPSLPAPTLQRVRRRRVRNGIATVAMLAVIAAGVFGVGSIVRRDEIDPVVAPGVVTQLPVPLYATDIEPGFGRTWVYSGNAINVEDPRSWGPPLKHFVLGPPTRLGELHQDRLLAIGEGSVWALAGEDFPRVFGPSGSSAGTFSDVGWSLVRIDPNTMQIPFASAVGGSSATDIAAGAGGVWVADNGPKGHFVYQFDPTGRFVAKIKVPAPALEVTTSDGTAWALVDDQNSETASLLRIDPKTHKIARTIPVAGALLGGSSLTKGIAVTDGAVWIARQTGAGDEVVRIDTRTDRVVATVLVADELRDLGSGEGRVWISLAKRPGIAWIDPMTNRLAGSVALPRDAQQMAAGDGFVWVTPNEGIDFIWRVTI